MAKLKFVTITKEIPPAHLKASHFETDIDTTSALSAYRLKYDIKSMGISYLGNKMALTYLLTPKKIAPAVKKS